jgi:hypothetical protein
MKLYRPKEIPRIEAEQFLGQKIEDLYVIGIFNGLYVGVLITSKGKYFVEQGDYLLKDGSGELQLIKKDDFEREYEEIKVSCDISDINTLNTNIEIKE